MKTDPNTVDPLPNDDSLAETPREDVDPIGDRVGCDLKPKRKRRPSMKKKAKDDA